MWLQVLTSVIFLPLIAYATLRLLENQWWKPKRIEEHFAKQGIRGPPYKFFIGNVKEMAGLMMNSQSKLNVDQSPHNILPSVLSFYTHWKKIYGPTFLIWFGSSPRLVIADPDLVREILVSRSQFYTKLEAPHLLRQLEGGGLLNLQGEVWAHRRKILTPTFHMENIKMLVPHIGKTVVDMVEELKSVSTSEEFEIDVSEWFQGVTEEVITRIVFGQSYDDGKSVIRLQAQQMVLASEAYRNVFIPGYRFLPTSKNIKGWKLDKEVRRNLTGLIEKRSEKSRMRKEEECAKDLLGQMMDANERLHNPLPITVNDMLEECKTFLFAGKQTTSNLLTWIAVLLAMHPDWQEKAREEVIRVCGSRDIPTRDQLSMLKTLGMVVHETLRLYPPTVATIRKTQADVDLGGYHIPRDIEILIPIMAAHHDARLWGPDATKFNPARFADGVATASKNPIAFIPFGLGARMCIGQNLAMVEAKLAMAVLLQRVSINLSPSYVHSPTVLLLLHPKHGAPLMFRALPNRI